MLKLITFSVYLILAISLSAQAQLSSYGAYSQFPQGSSRAMGMGGAYTAISDDVSGVLYNPAGPALGKWKVDAGGTKNSVTNREAPVFGSSSSFGLPYDFIFGAFGVRMGSFVLALGMSSPFNLDYEGFSERAKLKIVSADVYLAKNFGNKLSLGIGGHGEKLTQSYQDTSFGYDVETEAETTFVSVGISYRGSKGGFGISHIPPHSFDIDENLNSQLGTVTWFRDTVVPGKTTFGAFFNVSESKIIAIDFDKIDAVSNSIFVGSGTTGTSSETAIIEKSQTIVHGGMEWAISKSKGSEIFLRIGGYREPARVVGATDRTHTTFGLEVRFGPAALSVAFDQARDFTNTAQGFSLIFGSI